MPENNSKRYSHYLSLLWLAFLFRVGAQLLQGLYPMDGLPPFEAWYSGAMPYPLLLISQLIIAIVFGRIILQFARGNVRPRYGWGKAMLLLGSVYFATMLFRLIAGLSFASEHSWLGATIPALFHLVLALFIMIYGHYHYAYGTPSTT